MDYTKLKKIQLIEIILQQKQEIESLREQLKNQKKAGRKPDKSLPDKITQAQFMRFNGYSVNDIAKEMHVSRQTISKYLKTEL